MTFWIGQKVVCLKEGAWKKMAAYEVSPTLDGVYTIRGFHEDGDAIYLDEIKNPMVYRGGQRECCFLLKYFHPLVEKTTETGMAILREILDRETVKDSPRTPVKAR